MKFLHKLLALSILTTIVIAQSCPPLQPPDGVVFQCIDSSNNGTLDCLSGNITKGALAQYRCKNDSDSNWANSTMKCCRGRWKGLTMFNEFANSSCSSLPMILSQSNSTGPDENESSTQPTNMEGNETSSSTPSSALTSNDTTSPAPSTGNITNGNSTEALGSTEPTIEKSRAIDLTKGVSNSSDAGNATTPQSDTAGNASLPLSLTTSDNSSLTTTPSPSTSDNLNASMSSAPASSDPTSTVSNSSDSSSPSSTTISSLATTTPVSSENSSSSTSESSSVSSSTAASVDGSTKSNDTSAQISSTTGAPTSDNSSTTTTLSTSSSQPTPSNSSDSSTTVPSVAGETTGQVPPTNTSLIIDDTESRQSKDLKLSLGATGNVTNGTSDNSNSTEQGSTPAIPTVGASLTITNSSTPSNSSGGESTTTPSPANSSTTSSSSSSTASDSTSTTMAPENLSNGNGSTVGGDGNSTTDFKTLALNLHNKLRSSHRSQPLVLNETLNQIAQSWAENLMNQSKLVATPGKRSYSENLFKISGGDKISETEAIEGAMKSWSSSKSWFNYTNPKPTGFSQILWNATTQFGIGLASGNDSTIVVATYYPRGNIVSVGSKADPNFYFKKNVFPEISNATQVSPVTGNSTSPTDGQNPLTNNSTTTT